MQRISRVADRPVALGSCSERWDLATVWRGKHTPGLAKMELNYSASVSQHLNCMCIVCRQHVTPQFFTPICVFVCVRADLWPLCGRLTSTMCCLVFVVRLEVAQARRLRVCWCGLAVGPRPGSELRGDCVNML